jgi:hypothetical protein
MKKDKNYLLFFVSNLLSSTTTQFGVEGTKKQYIGYAPLFLLMGILVFGGCTSTSSGESKILQKLRKSDHLFELSEIVQTSYFFYPSTMRMINVDNMPNWNEAIKDLHRLSLSSMWPDRFDDARQREIIEDLKSVEGFSLFAEMEGKHSKLKLLGRKNGSEAVLIYNDTTTSYVIHMLGKLNYAKLIKLSTDLREAETTGTGLSFLKKAMGQDTDRATRRRKYEDRRRERAAAEQHRQDSIKAIESMEAATTQ